MVNIVVAKFNENIDWTKRLNHKVTIYDKSNNPVKGCIPLKNVGREGETFLYHIIHNYHNLDDVTVFLQGNPFEHLQILVGWRSKLTEEEIDLVINKMNSEIKDNSDFTTFYQVLYNDPEYYYPKYDDFDVERDCKEYFGEKYNMFTVSPGAQYIVPKKNILSRPLEFWKKLHADIYDNERLNGYSLEQLWYLVYNRKMNNMIGNHDQEKTRCLINSPPSFNYTPYSYFIKNNISI